MKIACFINEKQQLETKKTEKWIRENNGLKVDYFSMESRLQLAFERMGYDLIVLYSKKENHCLKQVHDKIVNLKHMKYTAFFNGKTYVLNIRDIFYLESYYRKTSIMMKEGSFRISARLNEEEVKLPKGCFVRISRHNIVNMQHINSLKGDTVEMSNGEVLYISYSRKKEFERCYREFLEINCILVQTGDKKQ